MGYLKENVKPNYDKFPRVEVPGREDQCLRGWTDIMKKIGSLVRFACKETVSLVRFACKETGSLTANAQTTVVFECYQGVHDDEVLAAIREAWPEAAIFLSADAMKAEAELYSILKDDITDDRVFGYMTRHTMEVYFDQQKTDDLCRRISDSKAPVRVVYGVGASYVCRQADQVVYLDMARWEIQMRFRRNEVSNVGFNNAQASASAQYKQGFFVDWRILDRWKKHLFATRRIDWFLDTNVPFDPKLISADTFFAGLEAAACRPFRVVPYFDAGVWGGQWMKEVCGLDPDALNYAWCFDCVPEENSLYLGFADTHFETPSINLVFTHPVALLGDNVYGRFGDEFPIRFDFLDTMQGGNLSLQVHPLIEYIQEKFGMHYTQEESYYILDAADDAHVYLGVKAGTDPDEMVGALRRAQQTGTFDAEKYVGCYPVKPHDHVLIPPGTIHCSGRNSMVLEVSATPYIFTFKLWDWGRVDLDGRPRPINIEHGKNVIQWNRTEEWVRREGINDIHAVAAGDGWREEHTGLHKREFIETRRHWFTKPVLHHTDGGVNVLNLVQGREAIVESPTGAFEPFVVHYAETFIVPAAVGDYTIRPYGESLGQECATLKAFVRKR